MANEYDLIVIGSGPAGQRAGIAAVSFGRRTAIVERNMDVGGGCLHQVRFRARPSGRRSPTCPGSSNARYMGTRSG